MRSWVAGRLLSVHRQSAWPLFAAIAGLAIVLGIGLLVDGDADPSGTAQAAEGDASPLVPLVELLASSDDAGLQRDVLLGMHQALAGRRDVPMPAGWPQAAGRMRKSSLPEVRELTQLLSLIFGDPTALAELRSTLVDPAAPADKREQALAALVQKRDSELVPVLQRLAKDGAIRGAVIRALAAFGDQATPKVILDQYSELTPSEKNDAVATLCSRPAYALAMLDAMEAGRVARADLSSVMIRQLQRLGNNDVNRRLREVWGVIRPPSKDKQALIADYRKKLAPELAKADVRHGRLLFSKTCAGCHVLFGEGRKVGPDLTGSQRANLEYVLTNLIDPSAVVGRDFQLTVVETVDGRVLTGVVKFENENSVTLLTANDQVIVPRSDIDQLNQSRISMMPEDMLTKLSAVEIRDLIGYLASPQQVPLPGASE